MAIIADAQVPKPQTIQYLSDHTERILVSHQGWGKLGIGTCAFAPGTQPLKLQIGQATFDKGLGHHAPGEIVIDLNGECDLFEAEAGVQWQGSTTGSVAFEAYVDGKKVLQTPVLRESDPPITISIPVTGAAQLRLTVTDGGDGIACDCANWANARLTLSADPKAHQTAPSFDIAPFARIVSWDPARMDGERASRVEEYHADDVFLETPVKANDDGSHTATTDTNGQKCIGLQWLERRYLRSAGIEPISGNILSLIHI